MMVTDTDYRRMMSSVEIRSAAGADARHGLSPAVAAADARHGGGTDGARLDVARSAALPRATMATTRAGVRKRAQERERWIAMSCHGVGIFSKRCGTARMCPRRHPS